MTFCTFKTNTLIQQGTVVQSSGSLVTPNDSNSSNLIVGVVMKSYEADDGQAYSEVHLGGSVIQALLKENWDGNWSPITVLNDGIKAASTSNEYHGYLIPSLPIQEKSAGELVSVYWRGII